MLKVCASFSIMVGAVAAFFGVSLSLLTISLNGGWSLDSFLQALVVFGALFFAGLLYALSGMILWNSRPAVTGTTISLQGIAWGLCLAYCSMWFIELQGHFGVGGRERQSGDSFDEEVVMMVFIPTAVLFLAAVQLIFLWKAWRRQRGLRMHDEVPLK